MATMGELAPPVTKLKLTEPLGEFPQSVLDHAETLVHLDLSGTGLSGLPDAFGRLNKLKVAFFSNCRFKVFPKQLASCPELEMVAFRSNGMEEIPENSLPAALRWLILTNNHIKELPRSIGRCSRLQKCMLSGNRLTSLPDEMAACRKLGLLRLSANHMGTLPSWLFSMPELAFLSFAGNPCSAPPDAGSGEASGLPGVLWADLEIEQLLGEGASGIIYKGTRRAAQEPEPLAIKLFKGDVTSDGTPMDEMRACITAGSHHNLIDPLGEIRDHPDQKGLVMQLIPPAYTTLGEPPSLQSCTRDCFLPGTRLSTRQGLGILRGIAAAAAHLHERGVSHGDLYAHNILYNGEGHALLGDFGAASVCASSGYPTERLEVLALAHLIDDIRGLFEPALNETEVKMCRLLEALHKRCSGCDVAGRPTFADIVRELDSIDSHAASPLTASRTKARRPSLVEVQA